MNGPITQEKMIKPLAIRETQIKTTIRYYCIPTRMATIKRKMTSIGKAVEKLDPHTLLVGM